MIQFVTWRDIRSGITSIPGIVTESTIHEAVCGYHAVNMCREHESPWSCKKSVPITRNLGGRHNVRDARLVEPVEVTLENSLSHGRRRPARLCYLADGGGSTRFVLEWSRLVCGANSRIWRRCGTTTRLHRGLCEGRAAKREPSQKVSSTIVLCVGKCGGRILRETIGYGGACTSSMCSNWNLGFSLLLFKEGGWTEFAFEWERSSSGGGGLSRRRLGQEIGQNGGRRWRKGKTVRGSGSRWCKGLWAC